MRSTHFGQEVGSRPSPFLIETADLGIERTAHPDLSPEKVLIDQFPRVKVADFVRCSFIDEPGVFTSICPSLPWRAPISRSLAIFLLISSVVRSRNVLEERM
jgi:serine/threonine protein kinase